MKTTSSTCHFAGTLVAWIPLLAPFFAPVFFAAAVASPSIAAELQAYTLFMGADLDVQMNKDLCRVRDVSGGSFHVKAGGKEVSVPMDAGPINLRVQQSLKLTEDSAVIAKLKGERAYTPANDPYRKFVREQPGGAGNAAYDLAAGRMVRVAVFSRSEVTQAGPALPGAPSQNDGMTTREKAIDAAQQAVSDAVAASESDIYNVGAYAGRLQDDLAKELFDAMDVTFEVSSEKPLTRPYVVILTRYHERGSRPGASRNWIYAQALDPIDRTPRKVRVFQGGFPAGFELEEFKVHLYDRGQELATNVVEKRVPLTREEAFQYMKIDYLGSHKGATLPPVTALGRLPADIRTRLTGNQVVPILFVQVSKDGFPLEAFIDESCSRKVEDPYVRSAIMDLRFQPALDKGKAVEGTCRLNLADVRS